MRRQLAKGVRMYTGDDFNYAELIAGDDAGLQRRPARHLRCHRAGRLRRARGARRRRPRRASTTSWRRPCRSRATSSRRRPASTRPASCSWPTSTACRTTSSWSAASRARARSPHLAELFRLADRAGLLRDPDLARAPHERACWPCTGSPDARLSRATSRTCRSTRRRCASSSPCRPSSRPARGAASAPSIRGATRCRQPASTRRPRQIKDAGLGLSGYCRGGFFPAADAAGLRAALEDNRKAVDEAKALGAPCLVLVVGALPGALAGKPASKDIGLARAQVLDGIAATLEYATERRHAARHRAAASHAGAPTAPASTRWSRRSTSATRSTPAAPARSASRSTSTTCWWDPKLASQIARAGARAPARLPRLRLAGADARSAQRPRHDGRRHRRAAARSAAWSRPPATPAPIEVEIFSDRWWARPADEVLDTCIARYRTVV